MIHKTRKEKPRSEEFHFGDSLLLLPHPCLAPHQPCLVPHHTMFGTPSSHAWNPTWIWYPITYLEPHHLCLVPLTFFDLNPIPVWKPIPCRNYHQTWSFGVHQITWFRIYFWWLVESYLIDGNGVASWLFWEFFHAWWKILFSHGEGHWRNLRSPSSTRLYFLENKYPVGRTVHNQTLCL